MVAGARPFPGSGGRRGPPRPGPGAPGAHRRRRGDAGGALPPRRQGAALLPSPPPIAAATLREPHGRNARASLGTATAGRSAGLCDSRRRPGLAGGRLHSEPRAPRMRATGAPRSRRATVAERQRAAGVPGCASDACESPRASRRRATVVPGSRARTAPGGETGPPGTEAPKTRAGGRGPGALGRDGRDPGNRQALSFITRPRRPEPPLSRLRAPRLWRPSRRRAGECPSACSRSRRARPRRSARWRRPPRARCART